MPASSKSLFAIGSVTAALTLLVSGPAAYADSSSDLDFCWANESTNYSACFATESEVLADVEAVTGHELVYPSDGGLTGAARSQPASKAVTSSTDATAATAYVIATIYDDQNYGGGSYTFTDTHSTTCSAYSYTFNTMPGGWDNRVSSFKSYGSCKTRLSENANQGGRSVGPVASKAYVGDTLNDRASSAFITG